VAEVQVNRKTGEIEVIRFHVVHDCGQIINPDGLRNQIEGNIVQTVSRTLKEKVTLTRSTLHRCFQHHGISRLPAIAGEKPAKQPFKAYPIGYFHIDIAEVRTAEGKLHLFVAVDRTSKFAFAQLHEAANSTLRRLS
jgi:hypothetical protein